MSIPVVCPGCHKGFRVSDKFAGKSGPCPHCKTTITVPAKMAEVKVHAPTAFADGGRSTTGQLITKPIARKDTRLEPVMTVAVVGGAVTVLLITWAAGGLIQSNLTVRTIGLLLVSPPLVIGAYAFLRDDELEPHRGTALYLRSAVCALSYVVLWGIYSYLAGGAIYSHLAGTSHLAGPILTGELWEWLFVVPPFLVTGALVALACLDLDLGSGFFHYAFYVLLTVVLRWAAGMGWL